MHFKDNPCTFFDVACANPSLANPLLAPGVKKDKQIVCVCVCLLAELNCTVEFREERIEHATAGVCYSTTSVEGIN